MRFFNPRISQDQFLSGLTSAASGIAIAVPILLSLVIAHGERFNWGYVSLAFAMLGITTAYVAVKIFRARRGTISLNPGLAFVLTCFTVMTLVFGDLATYHWSGEMFIACLVLPVIFFAVIGDNHMLFAGWLVTAAAVALCLHVEHLPSDIFWARFLVFSSLAGVAGLMVAPMIRKLHNRFRSRDALSDLTKALATAESIESALSECVALVHTVIPCDSAVLYAHGAEPQPALSPVAEWSRDDATPIEVPTPQELPAGVDFAIGARLVGSRCFVPAGYSSAGELVLVIDGIDVKQASAFFVEEAAGGLSSSLLLMTARLAYVSNLREESRTDPLTGLANRRALEERLGLVTAQASRSGAPVAVAMIDLDHFKLFNDLSGHQSGDELLRLLSDALDRRLRAQDLLARYGGEEFCVVLPDTDLLAARVVLEDLRAIAPTVLVGGRAATISAGIAEWRPGETTALLLERADQALYVAKEQGRDRVIVATALTAQGAAA